MAAMRNHNRHRGFLPHSAFVSVLLLVGISFGESYAVSRPPPNPSSPCVINQRIPHQQIHSHSSARSSSSLRNGLIDSLRTITRLITNSNGFRSLTTAYTLLFPKSLSTRTRTSNSHGNMKRECSVDWQANVTTLDLSPDAERYRHVREWLCRIQQGRLTLQEKRIFLCDVQSGKHTLSSLRNKLPDMSISTESMSTSHRFANVSFPSTIGDAKFAWLRPNPDGAATESFTNTGQSLKRTDPYTIPLPSQSNAANLKPTINKWTGISCVQLSAPDSTVDPELDRQARAYREQKRIRMNELANQKILAAVGARAAVPRDVPPPPNAPRTLALTTPPVQANDARIDNIATGSSFPKVNAIQDSYWRRRLVSERSQSSKLETKSESPSINGNPTVFADKGAFQRLNRPSSDLPTPGLSSLTGSRVSSVVERPLSTNTNKPTFSYLNSYHSQRQASVQSAVAARSFNSIPIADSLPRMRPLPSSREVPVVANEKVDPVPGQRKGPIRMPIPLEDRRSTSGTIDTTTTSSSTTEDNRRAQQRLVRDALTRSLASTVSQDERSKKWGIDMSKI
jgi:hypothetical protein